MGEKMSFKSAFKCPPQLLYYSTTNENVKLHLLSSMNKLNFPLVWALIIFSSLKTADTHQ